MWDVVLSEALGEPGISEKSKKILRNQVIDENQPGTILRDFTTLVEFIGDHKDDYDLFVFVSFRYYHSYFGAQAVRDKAVVIPTAEDDRALRFPAFRRFLEQTRGFLFLTGIHPEKVADTHGFQISRGLFRSIFREE